MGKVCLRLARTKLETEHISILKGFTSAFGYRRFLILEHKRHNFSPIRSIPRAIGSSHFIFKKKIRKVILIKLTIYKYFPSSGKRLCKEHFVGSCFCVGD